MAESNMSTHCSICLNYFTKPKIIDCHHTFCDLCLEDYVQKAASNNQFPCPLCRKNITIPQGGVADFPVNFYIPEKEKSMPGGNGNVYVNLPTEDSERKVAVSLCRQHKKENDLYCKDCNRTLCYKCFITGHQGHTLQNVEDVESELKIILKELGERVQTKITFNNCMVDSVKKEVFTLAHLSAVECGKVDHRVEKVCRILKDEGEKLKLKMKDSNLEQANVMTEIIKNVEQQTEQMEEVGKQIAEILNKKQLEVILNATPKLKQAINGIDKDFTILDYSSPEFQDGNADLEELSNQIGRIRKKGDDRFECNFDVGNNGARNRQTFQYRCVNQTPRFSARSMNRQTFRCGCVNQGQICPGHEVQGVLWTLECHPGNVHEQKFGNTGMLHMLNQLQQQTMEHPWKNEYVTLRLVSPDVLCQTEFTLKIINVKDDSKSLTVKATFTFTNQNSEVGLTQYDFNTLNSTNILKPENGFINSHNKITAQVIFLSLGIQKMHIDKKIF
ncbi:hypothetical protein SNE40_016259 [Patella caerulea]|uniref:Uncharacterized protein n=1 Tax=Patella caerulea TaxID=87958 RepID=A0AAN8J9L5_PATCE